MASNKVAFGDFLLSVVVVAVHRAHLFFGDRLPLPGAGDIADQTIFLMLQCIHIRAHRLRSPLDHRRNLRAKAQPFNRIGLITGSALIGEEDGVVALFVIGCKGMGGEV